MEEGLVLYCRETWVVQEPTVHEVPLLEEIVLREVTPWTNYCAARLVVKFLVVAEIIRVPGNLNRIVSGLRVETPFHQDVEEETYSGVVRETAVDVGGPEERVRLLFLSRGFRRETSWVGETDQVYSHMADDSLFEED